MAPEYDEKEADPYVYPGTDILRNLENIRDSGRLQAFETAASVARQGELEQNPVRGNFDLTHLKEIHRRLFQDVYPWAGQPRTIDIAKGNDRFGSHLHIESYMQHLGEKLRREREQWRANPAAADLADRLAWFMGEINALHPFREGNGRTQRVFIGQLAREHDFKIHWKRMTRGQMLSASISSFRADHLELARLLRANLTETRPPV